MKRVPEGIKLEEIRSNFDKGNVVLYFSAQWCGPCKVLEPIVKEVSEEFDDVEIIKVDIDNHPEIAAGYSIRGIPVLLFLQDGLQRNRSVGTISIYEIRDLIKTSFGK